MESFWKRVLTRHKGEDEKPKEAPKADDSKKPGLAEKVLNEPVGRRQFLGGAASSAGALAGNTANALTAAPQVITKEVIKYRVPELLTKLVPQMEEIMHFTLDVDRVPRYYPEAAESIINDIPLINGSLDIYAFGEIANLSQKTKKALRILPADAPLAAFKDEQLINDAFRTSGTKWYFEDGLSAAKAVSKSINFLERIAGIGDDSTVEQLDAAVKEKIYSIAKNIASNPSLYPPENSHERYSLFRYLENAINNTGNQDTDAHLTAFVRQEVIKGAELSSQKSWEESEKAAERVEEYRKERKEQLQKETERSNIELQKRKDISCSVEQVVREPRDAKDAKVFLLVPQKSEIELSRMHVQHLRQLLMKEKIVDNFDPADTQIERIGNRLRISTTDAKFADYLASFTEGADKVELPHRLQVPVSLEE